MPVATSAEDFLPTRLTLGAMRKAAAQCKGCDLYKNAAQTVFGEGPRWARMILLGEVPGDEAKWIIATYHPSAILRAPQKADRERMRAELIDDLQHAAKHFTTTVS
jgi:uracil-DNA glycosylase